MFKGHSFIISSKKEFQILDSVNYYQYMPSPKTVRRVDKRDCREYMKRQRREKTQKKGKIPGISGNQTYLTEREEFQLVSKLLQWENKLTQPVVGDIPKMVSFFVHSILSTFFSPSRL
jgi:hypothetical protein